MQLKKIKRTLLSLNKIIMQFIQQRESDCITIVKSKIAAFTLNT